MAVDAQNLSKRFGRTLAVDGATFRAEPGERVALVGRNGAGKTTLLRMLATFLPPTSGAASVSGFDLFSQSNAVREIVGKGEVTAGSKIASALKAQLASKPNFTVVLDETLGAGFTVKIDGGRVEYDFTAATIAAELAKRLRPDLAKLMQQVGS